MSKTLSPVERAHELSHFASEFSLRVAQGVVYDPVQPDGTHPYFIDSPFRPNEGQSTGTVPQAIAGSAVVFEKLLPELSTGEIRVLHDKFGQMARGLEVVGKGLEGKYSSLAHHVGENIKVSLPDIERFVRAAGERLATLERT